MDSFREAVAQLRVVTYTRPQNLEAGVSVRPDEGKNDRVSGGAGGDHGSCSWNSWLEDT